MNLERWSYMLVIIALVVMVFWEKCGHGKTVPCPTIDSTHRHVDTVKVHDTVPWYKPLPFTLKNTSEPTMVFVDSEMLDGANGGPGVVTVTDYVPYMNCTDTTNYKDSLVNAYGKVYVFDKVYDNKLQWRSWLSALNIPKEIDTVFVSTPVKGKPKRIGLGVQFGTYYNGKAFKLYGGVGVSYNFLRL